MYPFLSDPPRFPIREQSATSAAQHSAPPLQALKPAAPGSKAPSARRPRMPVQRKSACQLRLEARSRAVLGPASIQTSSKEAQPPVSSAQLALRLDSRIARAAEARERLQQRREASARARVQHARRVAREQAAKRRAQSASTHRRTRQKLEVARARRSAQLGRLAYQCRQRAQRVLEQVEAARESQRRRESETRAETASQLHGAARRRAAQTQAMVRRLSARWRSVERVKDRVGSAKFIQRWYRRHVEARAAAEQLRAVETHVAAVERAWAALRRTGFDASMALLQRREVAAAAQRVLRALLPRVGTASRESRSVNFRVLLMAGMIACHPREIMGDNFSARLAFAARGVLGAVAAVHSALAQRSSRELKAAVAALEAKFAFYLEAFSRWKARDAERLAGELLGSYLELFELQQRYEASAERAPAGDGLHELALQTQRQLQQLRRALAQVVGEREARARVADVERAASRAQPGGSDEDEAASGNEPDEEVADREPPEPSKSKPQPQQQVQQVQEQEEQVQEQDDQVQEQEEQVQKHEDQEDQVQEPPAPVKALLSDRRLVHELALDPHFQLVARHEDEGDDVEGSNTVEGLARRVRLEMVRAFWDQIVDANDVAALLARTEELRERLAATLAVQPALVERVSDALRPDALQVLLSDPVGNLAAIKARCDAVLRAILAAESPAGNEATRAFMASLDARAAALGSGDASAGLPMRVMADFLAFALDKAENIRQDMVQAHVGMLGAYLQRHGVEYEQKLVREALARGQRLGKTEHWLRLEMQARWPTLEDDERSRLVRGDAAAFSRFLRAAVMALVLKHIEGGADAVWPESFELDVDRVRGVRDAIDRVAVVATLVAGVQDFLARQRRVVAPRDFFAQLGGRLRTLLASPGISGAHLATQAVADVRQLDATQFSVDAALAAELQALEQRLQSSLASGSPVFALFAKRAAAALETELLAADTAAGGSELHASLAPFAEELQSAARRLRRLARHNEAVYAAQYNAMIKRLVASA